MAEDRQPFTDYVTKAKRSPHTAPWGWIATGLFAALLAAALLLWAKAVGKVRALETLPGELADANAALATAQNESQTNQDLIASLQSQLADLQQKQQASAEMSKSLQDEMSADLASKDVTISNLQGQLTVTIVDRVMFDSGEAVLKPDGQAVMRKVAAILADHPELKIQVIGHTDNLPIRPEARARFASNWELSTARALAAVHFLTEQAGVDPRRVGAVGDGEFRPVADNSTAAGRAKNRRIEIAILPNEPAAASPLPTPAPAAFTNSPPPDDSGTNLSAPPSL